MTKIVVGSGPDQRKSVKVSPRSKGRSEVDQRGVSASGVHTSAQLDQRPLPSASDNEVSYQRKARAKYLSTPLAISLAELRSPLEKSYRNTVYCNRTIAQDEGRVTSKYCGNRWCLVCSRIRTARAIDAYMPVLKGWQDPHFVTLSLTNCTAFDLGSQLDMMMAALESFRRSMKRTHHLELKAIRKIECTYNVMRGDYHPHFHVIVAGAVQAELLRADWLRRFPTLSGPKGQDVKPCDERSLIELFKYFTKVTTKKRDSRTRQLVPVRALDQVFQAMAGRRVWQPLGFVLPKRQVEAVEASQLDLVAGSAFKQVAERVFWEWEQGVADWVDKMTGEVLSNYDPSEEYRRFVETATQ